MFLGLQDEVTLLFFMANFRPVDNNIQKFLYNPQLKWGKENTQKPAVGQPHLLECPIEWTQMA